MSKIPGQGFKEIQKRKSTLLPNRAVLFVSLCLIQKQQDHVTRSDAVRHRKDLHADYVWMKNKVFLSLSSSMKTGKTNRIYHRCFLVLSLDLSLVQTLEALTMQWHAIHGNRLKKMILYLTSATSFFCPFSPSKLVQLHHT